MSAATTEKKQDLYEFAEVELGLDLDALKAQAGNPSLYDRAHALFWRGVHTAKGLPRDIKHFIQRGRRGWADSDSWDLHSYIARTLGPALIHMSENLHGYPGRPPYDNPEDWELDVRDAGEKLVAWSTWDRSEADYDLDWGEARKMHDKVEKDAKEALRWVADNFGDLWD